MQSALDKIHHIDGERTGQDKFNRRILHESRLGEDEGYGWGCVQGKIWKAIRRPCAYLKCATSSSFRPASRRSSSSSPVRPPDTTLLRCHHRRSGSCAAHKRGLKLRLGLGFSG